MTVQTLQRLPYYLHYLKAARSRGEKTVSASASIELFVGCDGKAMRQKRQMAAYVRACRIERGKDGKIMSQLPGREVGKDFFGLQAKRLLCGLSRAQTVFLQ